jgi:hypothetical protein
MKSDKALMCTIKGCNDKAIAKGLCARHYMRLRRTGNANSARKRGRPQVPPRIEVEVMRQGSNLSKRSLARYNRALKFIDLLEDPETRTALLKAAARPSGFMSFSKLLELAEFQVILKNDL